MSHRALDPREKGVALLRKLFQLIVRTRARVVCVGRTVDRPSDDECCDRTWSAGQLTHHANRRVHIRPMHAATRHLLAAVRRGRVAVAH